MVVGVGVVANNDEYFLFLVLTQDPWVSQVAVTELNSPQ